MKGLVFVLALSIVQLAEGESLLDRINAKNETDTTIANGKVTVGGYIDTYYGYDFNKPSSGDRPYFVSSARHNEMTINLAYVDLKYTASNIRARFIPGFGTYVNSNYAAEPGSLKNIIEGNIGVRISAKNNIWIDAGVLDSHYTNESAVSKDHLMYSRSFAPEYVPYYLSGVKISFSLNQKTNLYLFLINGWQQIVDQNKGKSIGTKLAYSLNDNLKVNWNTYVGDERSTAAPQNRMRYFTDVHFVYSKGPMSATGCVYTGIQQRQNTNGSSSSDKWWQANLIGGYSFTKKISLSGRIEYFSDPKSVQITPITKVSGFSSYSTGLCLNYKIAVNIMARLEGRAFFSSQEVYERGGSPSHTSNLLISNLTIWF